MSRIVSVFSGLFLLKMLFEWRFFAKRFEITLEKWSKMAFWYEKCISVCTYSLTTGTTNLDSLRFAKIKNFASFVISHIWPSLALIWSHTTHTQLSSLYPFISRLYFLRYTAMLLKYEAKKRFTQQQKFKSQLKIFLQFALSRIDDHAFQ